MSTYNYPTKYNEHKDRHNNPYFNMLRHGEDIPAQDDYSEESFPESKARKSFGSQGGVYREGVGSICPSS